MKRILSNWLSTIGGKFLFLRYRIFGMGEIELRNYFKSVFNSAIEKTINKYKGNYPPNIEELMSLSLVEAYELYELNMVVKVKPGVFYHKVLVEELLSSKIDILDGKYRTDIKSYNEEDKFRMIIREGFGEYVKGHIVDFYNPHGFTLFEEMKIKSGIGAYYQAMQNNHDLIMLKEHYDVDCDKILDEECNRAIESYLSLFSNPGLQF